MGMYKELLNEIELHKNLYEVANLNYEYYDRIFDASSNIHMDLYNNIMKMQYWLIEKEREDNMVRELEYRKGLIDKCINETKDIIVKISQLRDMGLTQEQVAEILGIGDRHVRRIEAKLRRMENAV